MLDQVREYGRLRRAAQEEALAAFQAALTPEQWQKIVRAGTKTVA